VPYRVAKPPLYGQLFFNDQNDLEGWSEGYWINTSNAQNALDTLVDEILVARMRMMPADFRCIMARVHDTTMRGGVLVETRSTPLFVKVNFSIFSGQSIGARDDRLVIWAKQITGNPKVHAVRPIHGLPGGIFSVQGSARDIKTPNANWDQACNRYENVLKANCSLVHLVTKFVPVPPAKIKDGDHDTVTAENITAVNFPSTARYRKTGRPFGLLQGRRAK
jgi:hypothetical protein